MLFAFPLLLANTQMNACTVLSEKIRTLFCQNIRTEVRVSKLVISDKSSKTKFHRVPCRIQWLLFENLRALNTTVKLLIFLHLSINFFKVFAAFKHINVTMFSSWRAKKCFTWIISSFFSKKKTAAVHLRLLLENI